MGVIGSAFRADAVDGIVLIPSTLGFSVLTLSDADATLVTERAIAFAEW
jgi:hypothetical protein